MLQHVQTLTYHIRPLLPVQAPLVSNANCAPRTPPSSQASGVAGLKLQQVMQSLCKVYASCIIYAIVYAIVCIIYAIVYAIVYAKLMQLFRAGRRAFLRYRTASAGRSRARIELREHLKLEIAVDSERLGLCICITLCKKLYAKFMHFVVGSRSSPPESKGSHLCQARPRYLQ